MEENQQQNFGQPCRKNCGFFGNASFDGFCSKCHQDEKDQDDRMASALQNGVSIVDRSPIESTCESVAESDVALTSETKTNLIFIEDAQSTQLDNPDVSTVINPPPKVPSASVLSDSLSDFVTDSDRTSSTAPAKRNRCTVCNKRVGPASKFSCRCEGVFCSAHRYSDSHGCPFDYRKAGQDDIRKSNPQILSSKLPKI